MTDRTRFTDGSIVGRHARLPGPLRDLHRAVLAAGVIADRPQDRVVGPDALPGALLQPEQDLGDHRRVQAGEADLP